MIVEALERARGIACVERVEDGAMLLDHERQAPLHRREPMHPVHPRLGELDRAPYALEPRRLAEEAMEGLVEVVERLDVLRVQRRGLPVENLTRLRGALGAPGLGRPRSTASSSALRMK